MASAWTKTKFIGVRYREHATRKHGIRPDRYFALNYKTGGRVKNEGVGWESEGWTAEKAFNLLAEMRANLKAGSGPTTLAQRREAQQEQEEIRKAARRAKAKQEITFGQFWELYYWPAATAHKKPKSVDAERHLFAKWLAPLHDVSLPHITQAKLDAVVSSMRKAGKAPATIKYAIAVVSQVWNHAALLDVVAGENPTRKVKMPQKDNRRTRFLSPAEAKTLLTTLWARSIDSHDEAVLSLFCGMRAGEIHAATWHDVDFEAKTILLRDTKNKRNRHAYITPEVEAVLRRRGKKDRSGYIFPAVGGGSRRWVPATFDRVVRELGFNEGISDARQRVCFHTLRHTYASWLVQKGTPLYTVAQLLGHSTIAMTQRYSHLAQDTVRSAAMSVQGILDQKRATIVPFAKGS